MNFNLIVLPGDGVGPEVTAEAVKVLQAIGKRYGHNFNLNHRLVGGAAIDAEGAAVSAETLKLCEESRCRITRRGGRPQVGRPAG